MANFYLEYCFEDSTLYSLVNSSMVSKRSPVECQKLCQANDTCTGFSYNFANQSCYQVKKVIKASGNSGAANSADLYNWMSGPKICNLPNKTGELLRPKLSTEFPGLKKLF